MPAIRESVLIPTLKLSLSLSLSFSVSDSALFFWKSARQKPPFGLTFDFEGWTVGNIAFPNREGGGVGVFDLEPAIDLFGPE